MRRELITDGGILVVGLAAAVLTFTTLSALGLAVGFAGALLGFQLAWLLPVVVDVAAIVAARVWLQGRADDATVHYARLLAMTCIGLSVVFNGGWHLLDAAGWTATPWWVVLPVTSVPPAVLAAVVHLGHLLHRTTPDHPVRDEVDHPVRATIEKVDHPVQTVPDHPAITGPDHPVTPDRTTGPGEAISAPAQMVQDDRTGSDQDRTTPDQVDHPELDQAPDHPDQDEVDHPDHPVPDDLADHLAVVVRLAAELGGPPSRNRVMAEVGCGTNRAKRLLDHLDRTTPTTTTEEDRT